ncbi:MAG TPA: hypothetical protein VGR95_18965 [Thermoanaerobaculia bacterium]|jgi:hypothetical protein|nr:hypothetical protein [Thermoanaerobaculia bacterium]
MHLTNDLKDLVITPHGPVHKDCIHLIEEGDQSVYPVCPFPPKDAPALRPRGPGGWIESATFTPSEPLRSMEVKFTVPDPPDESDGSLIYLFPGAQDAHGSTILQPVLQWGSNGVFGGSHWTIVSWHCTPEGQSRYSHHHKVHAGQTIVGTVQVKEDSCGPDSCDWIVEARVEDDPDKCARLEVLGLKQLLLFLIGGALEAYALPTGAPLKAGQDSCRLFPGSETVFRDICLVNLNCDEFRADWGIRYPNVCGFGVNVSRDKKRITLSNC